MAELENSYLILALAGMVTGTWGVLWARTSQRRTLGWWGRVLFVGALLMLGAASWMAALDRADGLIALGLSSGALVVLMLWEAPTPAWTEQR